MVAAPTVEKRAAAWPGGQGLPESCLVGGIGTLSDAPEAVKGVKSGTGNPTSPKWGPPAPSPGPSGPPHGMEAAGNRPCLSPIPPIADIINSPMQIPAAVIVSR